MTPLDRHTDQRIKDLEKWRPAMERRVDSLRRGLETNTITTNDTNKKVTEMWDYWTAGKVNGRIMLWLFAILGGCGGALAGVIAWIHR